MSNYVKSVDFASKDALTSGDPLKLIKGTEINTEFNNIQTAVATKADLASPAFTGNPTATTQATGNSSTRLATTAFVNNQIAANASNVAITGGTIDDVVITGLATDLAVADGGTGASSFTLNSVVLGNNVGALDGNMVAPGTSGNALVSNGTTWVSGVVASIGVGQTWQDVTSSRALNTSYTNSTGKPIFLAISYVNTAETNDASITVSGVEVASTRMNISATSGYVTLNAIVPDGATYSYQSDSALRRWVELR
jgi:hypothetical protein